MSNTVTTTTILLLIVGLAIGAGVGYFVSPKGETVEVPVEVKVEVSPLEGKTVKVGVLGASSESLETWVPNYENIIGPEVEDYLETLGIDLSFEFLVEHAQREAAVALEKVQAFKSMGIDLILGPSWSSHCQSSLSYANENDMLLLTPDATSPMLSIKDDALYRTTATDAVAAPAAAEIMRSWGIKAALILHIGDSWGDGVYNILTEELQKLGIEELGRIRYATETTEFSTYVKEMNDIISPAVEKYGADHVGIQVMITSREEANIMTLAKDYPNLVNIIWFSTESHGRDQRVLDNAGDVAVIIRYFSAYQGIDESSFLFQEFEKNFNELTGLSPGFSDCGRYDGAWLLVKTILETDSTDALPLREMLIPMSYKFFGTSGWLAMDEYGDRYPSIFDIWGYYEDPDTGVYNFRSWGEYNGISGDVAWDDTGIAKYGGITRPGPD